MLLRLGRSFRVRKATSSLEDDLRREILKEKSLYELLEVQKSAPQREIRASYLRLARQIHPDLTGRPSEEFSAITRAYQTLSDPHQRVIYDESLVTDADYYTVGVGKWKISLKYLLGASVTMVLAALATAEGRTEGGSETCPTTHQLKTIGKATNAEETKADNKEIAWKRTARPAISQKIDQKPAVFRSKESEKSSEPASQVVIKLPKDRSFSSSQV